MSRIAANYALTVSPDAMSIMDREASSITSMLGGQGWLEEYYQSHRLRLALDFEWCRLNIAKDSRILEVGAYPFFVSRALIASGFDVKSVDHPAPEVGSLASKLSVISSECDIERERLPFADSYFDEILFNEVFEHLRIDLLFTMDELRRVLKPGGRLWLSTPNVRSARGLVNFLFRGETWSRMGGGVYAQWHHLRTMGWMGHIREYTSKEVADFLLASGFVGNRVVYRGEWSNPLANTLSHLVPDLRPFFSCIALKPSLNP